MTQRAEQAVTDRAPAAMIAGAIPLIDVSGHLAGDAEASRKAAAQLRWAFENVGFYYLSGHGVARSLIDRTYEAGALCRRLVPLYALALDVPADFFDACFTEPHMILRMSRYPVIDGEDQTVASLVPHTDSGFMTLLPPNRVPGLSIQLPNGRWIDAP